MHEASIQPRDISLPATRSRLLKQVRRQCQEKRPDAIVIHGTHEPLERTSSLAPQIKAGLEARFPGRVFCTVEFPPEHRPLEFFSGIFGQFEEQLKAMEEGAVLDIRVAPDMQRRLAGQAPAFLTRISEDAPGLREKFAAEWRREAVKSTVFWLEGDIYEMVNATLPALFEIKEFRRDLFGFPPYLTERFIIQALAQEYPESGVYSLHTSPLTRVRKENGSPHMIVCTPRVANRENELPSTWEKRVLEWDPRMRSSPQQLVPFNFAAFDDTWHGVIELLWPMGDRPIDANLLMHAMMGSYIYFAQIKPTSAYFWASSEVDPGRQAACYLEALASLERARVVLE
jgi:hypothetical protein